MASTPHCCSRATSSARCSTSDSCRTPAPNRSSGCCSGVPSRWRRVAAAGARVHGRYGDPCRTAPPRTTNGRSSRTMRSSSPCRCGSSPSPVARRPRPVPGRDGLPHPHGAAGLARDGVRRQAGGAPAVRRVVRRGTHAALCRSLLLTLIAPRNGAFLVTRWPSRRPASPPACSRPWRSSPCTVCSCFSRRAPPPGVFQLVRSGLICVLVLSLPLADAAARHGSRSPATPGGSRGRRHLVRRSRAVAAGRLRARGAARADRDHR